MVSAGASTILTGPRLGTYYQIGSDIKTLASKFNLNVSQSAGSVENIRKLQSDPEVKLAFAQMDVLKNMKENGQINFQDLKMFLPLYTEEIHLIVHKDSKIRSIKDLENKIVNVGNDQSGSQFTSRIIAKELDLTWKEDLSDPKKALKHLLSKKIDAIFLIVGKPVKIYQLLPKEAKALLKFIPINDRKLKKYYEPIEIPAKTYLWQDETISTYAVYSLLVTLNFKNKKYAKFIKDLYLHISQNIHTFRKRGHPKWKEINPSFKQKNLMWRI